MTANIQKSRNSTVLRPQARGPQARGPQARGQGGNQTARRSSVVNPNPSGIKAPARTPRLVVLEAKKTRRIFILKIVVITLAVTAAIFSVVIAEGVIAQRQLKIDSITGQIANEQIIHQQLSAKVAKLEGPTRIENYAQNRLNMVSPTNIIYVNPAMPANPQALQPSASRTPSSTASPSSPIGSSNSQTAPQTNKTSGK